MRFGSQNGKMQRQAAEKLDILQLKLQKYNDGQARGVVYLRGKLNPGRLKRAVLKTLDRIPVFSSDFVEDDKQPYWNIREMEASEVFSCIHSNCTDEEAQSFLVGRINAYIGPQVKVRLISGSQRDTVCVIVTKASCDEGGLKEYLYLLASVYSSLGGHEQPEVPFSDDRSLECIRRRLHPLIRLRLYRKKEWDRLPETKAPRFPLGGNGGSPLLFTYTLPVGRFHALQNFAKQNEVSVDDVVLAACFRAMRVMFARNGAQPYCIPCVEDLRKYLPWGDDRAICNLSSAVWCELGAQIGAELMDTAQAVHKALGRRDNLYGLLRNIGSLANGADSRPYPLFAFRDIGTIDASRLVFDDIEINDAFVTGPVQHAPYVCLNLSTFEDSLTFSVGVSGLREDKGTLGNFLALIDRELPKE